MVVPQAFVEHELRVYDKREAKDPVKGIHRQDREKLRYTNINAWATFLTQWFNDNKGLQLRIHWKCGGRKKEKDVHSVFSTVFST